MDITTKEVDQMILIRYRMRAESPNQPSFVKYSVIGKVFGVDGSSVRRLILRRFLQMSQERMLTRKRRL